MANDKPTSLRMGFGYGQALRAGLGGIPTPRSPRQVNKILQGSESAREAIDHLKRSAEDPDWVPLIRHRISEGSSPEDISTEIYWIKRYAWAKAKGWPLVTRLKRHWPD